MIVFLSVVPFLWRVAAGADDLPSGDAWAYERIFETFHRTGHIRLVGWNDITLIGILPVTEVWVTIVGFGSTQMHLLGSVMFVGALFGVRSLLTTFQVGQRIPAIVAIGVASGLVATAGTYLSDPFALAGAVWAVAFACRSVRWVDSPSAVNQVLLGAVAAVAASFGFLVRQQMLVGVLAAFWVLYGRRRIAPHAWKAFALAFVLIAAPLYLWRSGMPHGGGVQVSFYPRYLLSSFQRQWYTLGMFLCSCLAWVIDPRSLGRRAVALTAGAMAAAFAAIAMTWSWLSVNNPLVQNVEERFGPYEGGVLLAVLIAPAVFGWVLVAVWWRRLGTIVMRDDSARLLFKLVALAFAVEAAVIVTTAAYFSRYTLMVAVLLAVVLMRERVVISTAAVLLTVAVAVSSYWELDNSLRPTEAVNRAAELAECMGIPPERLDATMPWDGVHYTGIASPARGRWTPDGLPFTYEVLVFVEMKRDAVLVDEHPGESPNWSVAGPIESSALLPGTSQDWWLVVRNSVLTTEAASACLETG